MTFFAGNARSRQEAVVSNEKSGHVTERDLEQEVLAAYFGRQLEESKKELNFERLGENHNFSFGSPTGKTKKKKKKKKGKTKPHTEEEAHPGGLYGGTGYEGGGFREQ